MTTKASGRVEARDTTMNSVTIKLDGASRGWEPQDNLSKIIFPTDRVLPPIGAHVTVKLEWLGDEPW